MLKGTKNNEGKKKSEKLREDEAVGQYNKATAKIQITKNVERHPQKAKLWAVDVVKDEITMEKMQKDAKNKHTRNKQMLCR